MKAVATAVLLLLLMSPLGWRSLPKSVQPGLAHSLNSQLSTLNYQLALGGRRGRAKQLRVESG
jgi:hypothetical protein